ncbi:putative transposase, partial [Aquiflexum sp.]|uniref:putative transposase n=1 Tax=Aquiflexum sp. TaxID=1872584 RepID=UPI0035946897
APHYANSQKDGRTLFKEIFTTPADICPDYLNKTLTVTIHSLSYPRRTRAAGELCKTLTETKTIYPGTDLKLIFKSMAVQFTGGQVV